MSEKSNSACAFGSSRNQCVFCEHLNSDHAIMTLEDFEKSLAQSKHEEWKTNPSHKHARAKKHHRHHRENYDDGEDHSRYKRRKRSTSRDGTDSAYSGRAGLLGYNEESTYGRASQAKFKTNNPVKNDNYLPTSDSIGETKRDSWMEQPCGSDTDYTLKSTGKLSESITSRPSKANFELKIHENELNKHHLQGLADGKEAPEDGIQKPVKHEVDYIFGDAGSQWRMSKLNRVYKQVEETGKHIDDLAEEQFGDLRAFDDAREEQIELERRDTYGEGYVGKQKPNGELFEERNLDMGLRDKQHSVPAHSQPVIQDTPGEVNAKAETATTVPMDPTTLNRLKAQMLKAEVRGSPSAGLLKAEYNNAVATFSNSKQPDVVVLGAMDNRMLAGSREGEVKRISNRRGRERGLIEENEDMSIEDMVRQERRSRNQAGGDGQRFAERIAKDAKFDVGVLPNKRESANSSLRMILITWTRTPKNWRSVYKRLRSISEIQQ